MKLKHIIRGYEILKQRAIDEFNQGLFDKSLATIKQASSLAIQFNWRYSDDDFESILDNISKKYITDVKDVKAVFEDRYVLVDDFCRSFILAIQYLDAFKFLGKHVLYVVTSSEIALGSPKSILDRVRSYDNVEILVVDDSYDESEKTRIIYNSIIEYAPSKVFLHTNEMSPCLLALYRLPKNVSKYMINLSDQRFWLGCRAIDYSIEFRPFGATVSHEKRSLDKSQLLYAPFYPIIDGHEFRGFPELTRGKVIVFTGGDFYKTISPRYEYWTIIKRLIRENPEVVVLFAIKSSLPKADKFIEGFITENHFENRFINIGFRDDINEVFVHSDIFLGTSPVSGSLMSQLAAQHKKPILQYYPSGTTDDETEQILCINERNKISFDSVDELLMEAKRLINDTKYRESQGNILFNSMIHPEQFNQHMIKVINGESKCGEFPVVDYKGIEERWLCLERLGFIDVLPYVIGMIGKKIKSRNMLLLSARYRFRQVKMLMKELCTR